MKRSIYRVLGATIALSLVFMVGVGLYPRVVKEFDLTGNYQIDRLFELVFYELNKISLGRANTDTKVGSLDAVYVRYTSNASANTEDTVPHNLGRKPEGYIVIYSDASCNVYASGTTWTSKFIYLKSTGTSVVLRIILF